MTDADRIRVYARENYVVPARQRKVKQLAIRVGDVVRELRLKGRVPAVCSALKTREFLQSNGLRLVHTSGPESGQSTTVTYTYEFLSAKPAHESASDAWKRLRGAMKEVFAAAGGGGNYLRNERNAFGAGTRTQ